MHLKRHSLVILLVGVALAAGAAALYLEQEPSQERGREEAARFMSALMAGTAPVGGPFTLEDQHGRSRSLADFRGSLVVLYFGYAFCPDICPTDLAAMAELVRTLGSSGDAVQPVFVTLDPERDTAEVLRSYAAAFHPRLVALRGSEQDVRRVATDYKVFFEKVKPRGSSHYVIDHMAFIFVLDRDGRYVAYFPPGTSAQRMKPVVLEMLEKPSSGLQGY
jgi:cytochrome oxidase Cu insertion factor (SCO1/SenC/PrrC family)